MKRAIIKPEQEEIEQIENTFKVVCKNNHIKWGTEKYKLAERMFFSGAIVAFNYSVVKWGVSQLSGRPILEKF